MIELVGVEGHWPPDSPIAWGAAALRAGEVVFNSITGARQPLVDWKRSADNGDCWEFSKPLTIRDEHKDLPIRALAIRREFSGHALLTPDNSLGGLLSSGRTRDFLLYAISGKESFEAYSVQVAGSVTWHALLQAADSSAARDLVQAALIVAPQSPSLHALRAMYAPNAERSARVARASLRSDLLPEFERFFAAVQSKDPEYWLNYENGIADGGGGLDISQAALQFHAMNDIEDRLDPVLRARYPFLDEVEPLPSSRFKYYKAASAKLGFSLQLQGRSYSTVWPDTSRSKCCRRC